jgi:hypothetical protein
MRDAVATEELLASKHLDHVDELSVGTGHLDVNLFGRGDLYGGLAGGSVSYDHRIRDDVSLFGEGWAGYGWGDRTGLEFGASAGMRWRF